MAYNNIDSQFAPKHYAGHLHLTNGTYTILDTKKPHLHPGDACIPAARTTSISPDRNTPLMAASAPPTPPCSQ
jgi:hypothetical protein